MRGTRGVWLERKNALMSCIMSFIRSPNGVYSMVLKPCSDLVDKNNQGSSMSLNRTQLNAAVEKNIISSSQADSLYEFLTAQSPDAPMFTFTHVLYYLGGRIAIGAMTLFMTLGWEAFGGVGVVSVSLAYAAIGLALANALAAKDLRVPAGICATFVECSTPALIYGLQPRWRVWPAGSVYRDYHRYVKWHWVYMELGTLAVGALIAWRYKYPF